MMNHSSSFYRLIISSSLLGGRRVVRDGQLINILKQQQQQRQYHSTDINAIDPLTLINPFIQKVPMSETESNSKTTNLPTTYTILKPGMILLNNYLSLKDQANIVNICEKWGMGPGGFYIPIDQNGEKLRLKMMCFGRNWDPITKYENPFTSDGSVPPPIPSQLISLAKAAIQDAQAHLGDDELPSMRPDICIVKFYPPVHGELALHQDCDESYDSLQRGLPVVSISIGDTAEFVYGDTRDENKLKRVYLESGDVLIFGGKSRYIFHALEEVSPWTAPRPLKVDTGLLPGRLNLTFRQI